MLRATVRSLNLSNRICNQNNFNISHSELCVQSVRRWRYRRPLELGTSKSKLFRIPEHPEQDPEELAELTRLSTIYNTKMKSLRAFFREEKLKRDEALAQKPQSVEDDADFERISKINDEWNREVAKVRDARLKAERFAMQQEIQWQLEQQREYEAEQQQKINELVLREKEAAKSFIVRENFDEALELALQEKSDFNFAIDIKGNQFIGRTGDQKQPLESN
ncbi:probable 28S ribosomal protein S26, mitochondrial [Sitodiplosis mosellana]|uniref:probable 28S ribosomal protein S26, mitochondrial n=1 Tax=Sitodiplosis mosellana TaxID=263140 RepID=UPI002444060B|nr:probable 28S ribosomal protein S26, mitochondrial [Sitodiplosis mosellana]